MTRYAGKTAMLRNMILATTAAIIFPLPTFAAEFTFPPGSAVSGRSVGQLSAEWWQWAMSIPPETSPLRDSTGANCGTAQQGAVWFLAGGFGSSKFRRTCVIPANRPLFFPVVNMLYYPAMGNDTYTCGQAKAAAALNNESAIDLFVELNGVALQDVKRYRVASDKCFDIFERIQPEQRPYKAYPSASDGYWILLKPLQRGRYTLKFGGRYNRESSAYGHMVQDIEYELIAQ
ncbi:hypothetical protein ACQUJT_23535 [Ralstonia pseudosolanacearum]